MIFGLIAFGTAFVFESNNKQSRSSGSTLQLCDITVMTTHTHTPPARLTTRYPDISNRACDSCLSLSSICCQALAASELWRPAGRSHYTDPVKCTSLRLLFKNAVIGVFLFKVASLHSFSLFMRHHF